MWFLYIFASNFCIMIKKIVAITGLLVWSLLFNIDTTYAQDYSLVVISTDLGNMKLKLYKETPLHSANFLKLASSGYFNGVMFHRVINHFMIQGGDPESKNAIPGARLGNGGPGYTIPAEFVPGLYHKKGALAAARTGDQINPKKESSGSQFYIVQGKKWRPGELDTLEMKMNSALKQNIYRDIFTSAQQELEKYKQEKKEDAFNKRFAQLQMKVDSVYNITPKIKFSEAQKKAYTTTGGYPPLDGSYTVFGEVIEGFDVLDRIAAVQTDKANRPVNDIKMLVKVIQ